MDPRFAAVETLIRVVRDQQSLTASMSSTLSLVTNEDRPLYRQFCFGLLRHYGSLQKISSLLITKPLAAKHADIELLILLGLYQIEHLSIPDHASVSRTVEVTSTLKKSWAKGLVNGVLRSFIRDRAAITARLQDDPVFRYAHPEWLIDAVQQAWPDHYQEILQENNRQAPLTLRVNRRKCSRDSFMDTLLGAGITCTACRFSHVGITLDTPLDIQLIPGFDEGWFSVQDEASQLAAGLLDLMPGLAVLDACAAPGGKSGHILESASDLDLLCLDIDDQRLAMISENLQRLQLFAQVAPGDARFPDQWWSGRLFDRILLDAPCTATGIIRRHPDIKLLRKPSDIDKLVDQQSALLASVWPLLKKDGLLVYSTCSILPQENHLTVRGFLSQTTDATELPLDEPWGIEMPVGRQLLPVANGHDGFYYARLRKN